MFFSTELSEDSARTIVMCAFGAHTYREVTRTQLASAIRYFTKGEERKTLTKKEKHELVSPLARMFLKKEIVTIRKEANLNNLSVQDVNKEGTF